MSRMGRLAAAAALALLGASAAGSICELRPQSAVRLIGLELTPNYFFKTYFDPARGVNVVAFAAFDGSRDVGVLYDVDGQRVIAKIPAYFDPVPSPDGRLVTVPSPSGVRFYDTRELEAAGMDAEPVYRSVARFSGDYQSVGLLRSGPAERRYRVIIQHERGLRFADFDVSRDAGGRLRVDVPRTPGGSRVYDRALCPNLDQDDIETPMISRDGRELSLLYRGTTKIYRIEPDGACRAVLDLGIPTSKVDFSEDGRRLVFHVVNSLEGYREDYRRPETAWRTDVFMYDRDHRGAERGEFFPVAIQDVASAYYPAWIRRPGAPDAPLILFATVRLVGDAASGAPERRYHFAVADPAPSIRRRLTGPQSKLHLAAIGSLWSHVCTEAQDINVFSAMHAPWSLDAGGCRELVDGHWEKAKRTIAARRFVGVETSPVDPAKFVGIGSETLRGACPENPDGVAGTMPGAAAATPARAGSRDAGPAPTYAQVTRRYCLGCHGRGERAIPLDDPVRLKSRRAPLTSERLGRRVTYANAIRLRIEGEAGLTMPPPPLALTHREKETIMRALEN